jgi:hypothetical protein
MADLKNVFLPNSLVVASTVSPDKQVITSLVQSFLVELEPRPKPSGGREHQVGRTLADPPLVASQSSSLFMQLSLDKAEAPVRVRIMGNVQRQPGARAVLVSRLAGTTYCEELSGNPTDGSYEVAYTVNAPANGLLLTLFLLVDRNITDGGLPAIVATVETVEFSLDTGAKAKA